MTPEHQAMIEDIQTSITLLRRSLDADKAQETLARLNTQVEEPDFWQDQDKARTIMQQRVRLEEAIKGARDLEQALADHIELVTLAESEGDEELLGQLTQELEPLQATARQRRLATLLNGEADENDCYLSVNAGAGGTEAQDWAMILLRMYSRWGETQSYKTELLDESPGEEAGLKSATLRLSGSRAYGWLKTETGVHRLVRISPFDSQSRRHTSFASVTVTPVVDDTIEIEILDKDLRIDTYRASGAGGQHVNRTDSAVRMTHLPTGITVQCQNDRSQHRNRAQAMDMLRARLYELELKQREDAAQAQANARSDIAWGNQIRSYVLQPYQMVKDLRTSIEVGNATGVLDGNIGVFLEGALAARAGESGS
ncbi:MAG: peptide chain release factor 2 [Pseudomonadota bacterium]